MFVLLSLASAITVDVNKPMTSGRVNGAASGDNFLELYFPDPDGWLVLDAGSEPLTVNVGAGCSSADKCSDRHWRYGQYLKGVVLTGSEEAIVQVFTYSDRQLNYVAGYLSGKGNTTKCTDLQVLSPVDIPGTENVAADTTMCVVGTNLAPMYVTGVSDLATGVSATVYFCDTPSFKDFTQGTVDETHYAYGVSITNTGETDQSTNTKISNAVDGVNYSDIATGNTLPNIMASIEDVVVQRVLVAGQCERASLCNPYTNFEWVEEVEEDDDKKKGLSGGAIAGIVIGVLVGFGAFTGGVVACVLCSKKKGEEYVPPT